MVEFRLATVKVKMKSCPYCNSDKGIELRYLSRYIDSSYSINFDDPCIYEHKGHMFVSECISCGRLILSDDRGGELPPNLFHKAIVVHPEVTFLHNAIPHEVRVTYEEAKRIQNLNTEAFSISIRKCIEIICKLNGIEKGGLAQKLKKLCQLLSLPIPILEAAECIKLIGNKAAHDIDDIHPLNAQQIDDFLKLLLEYIYVLPSKIEWFKHVNSSNNCDHPGLLTRDGNWVLQKGKVYE